MVVLIALGAFAAGILAGVGLLVALHIAAFPQGTDKPTEREQQGVVGKWFKAFTPAPEKTAVGSIYRTAGPWRRQRQVLQAQHNSKQKERETRMPHA